MGCHMGRTGPVRAYMKEGGDTERRLTGEEALMLRPRMRAFEGDTMATVAQRAERWDMIEVLAEKFRGEVTLQRVLSSRMPSRAAQVRELMSGSSHVAEALPGVVVESHSTFGLTAEITSNRTVMREMVDANVLEVT